MAVAAQEQDAKIAVAEGELRVKAGYEDRGASFGSPNTSSRLLVEEDIRTEPLLRFPQIDDSMEGWYDFKTQVNEEHGFRFGIDYTAWYQQLSDSLTGDDWAASGIFRVYGEWQPFHRQDKSAGRLVLMVDNRHKVGSDITAVNLGAEAGYIGQTATLFNDIGWQVINFNWQQDLGDGSGGLIAGRFDPSDYVSVLGYANPWTTFANLASLLNKAMAFPDASWGIGGGSWLGDENWYVKGSINDANGTLTNYEFFEGGSEFYYWGEVGWSPSRSQRYTTNIHLAAWHVDEREDLGLVSAEGVTIGGNWTSKDERWMLFGRAGWADGDSAVYQESYTLGFMRKFRRNADLLGLAVDWGDPPQDDLEAQTTGELFYRLQLAENLALTPNVQLLKDPALNNQEDAVWVTGLRIRFTL
ncbi:carbohydrate porin [Halioglobus maricola]|nr:carbohydrate porin [Halioglobus maricola]